MYEVATGVEEGKSHVTNTCPPAVLLSAVSKAPAPPLALRTARMRTRVMLRSFSSLLAVYFLLDSRGQPFFLAHSVSASIDGFGSLHHQLAAYQRRQGGNEADACRQVECQAHAIHER